MPQKLPANRENRPDGTFIRGILPDRGSSEATYQTDELRRNSVDRPLKSKTTQNLPKRRQVWGMFLVKKGHLDRAGDQNIETEEKAEKEGRSRADLTAENSLFGVWKSATNSESPPWREKGWSKIRSYILCGVGTSGAVRAIRRIIKHDWGDIARWQKFRLVSWRKYPTFWWGDFWQIFGEIFDKNLGKSVSLLTKVLPHTVTKILESWIAQNQDKNVGGKKREKCFAKTQKII